MNTDADDLIDERFGKGLRNAGWSPNWQWTLCQYEYYGATFYTSLVKRKPGENYRLLTETESGYATPFEIGRFNEQDALKLIEGFPPTNPEFKTDRK